MVGQIGRLSAVAWLAAAALGGAGCGSGAGPAAPGPTPATEGNFANHEVTDLAPYHPVRKPHLAE